LNRPCKLNRRVGCNEVKPPGGPATRWMLSVLLNMPTAFAIKYAFGRAAVAEPPREIVQQLAFLSATRQRLNQAYNLLAVPVTEQETFISKSLQKTLKSKVRKSLMALQEEQKAVEQQINALIQADAHLKKLFDLMVSVPGIGPVIATELLITTNEMQTINDPKRLACHAGVAPFEYRSGSSIRGKTRVSHQARKRLKSLLHMGTMSAIQVKAGRPVPGTPGLLPA
jgi:transposase